MIDDQNGKWRSPFTPKGPMRILLSLCLFMLAGAINAAVVPGCFNIATCPMTFENVDSGNAFVRLPGDDSAARLIEGWEGSRWYLPNSTNCGVVWSVPLLPAGGTANQIKAYYQDLINAGFPNAIMDIPGATLMPGRKPRFGPEEAVYTAKCYEP